MNSHETILEKFSKIAAILKFEREYALHTEGNYTLKDKDVLRRSIRIVIYDISYIRMLIKYGEYPYHTGYNLNSFIDVLNILLSTSLVKLDTSNDLSGNVIYDIMEYDLILYNINKIWGHLK